MDAGFLSVFEIGKYFMTKDTGEQFQGRWIITIERMDLRNNKNWTRIGRKLQPVASMVNMESRLEFGL